jgi:hypothetical protein
MPSFKSPLVFVCLILWCLTPVHGEPGSGSQDPAGALLSPEKERDLFSALDLSGDSFSPVREALSSGQTDAAIHALAEYFRHRSSPRVKPVNTPVRDPAAQIAIAQDAVKGRVQGGFVPLWHQFPDGKIDWLYNAPKNTPGEPPNNEWQWQLCRMYFWDSLSRAYRATGDERYARAWVEEMRSFVAECPPPAEQRNGPGSAWRTLEAGIRMADTWPTAYETFIADPQFTDADIALFLSSCLEHARYLKKYPTTGNWVATEMMGLYTVGVLFPEFKEASEWRSSAVAKSYAQEKEQFLPDGAQFELSTGYHNVALDSIMEIPLLAKRVGRQNELPADYIQRMEKAYDFDLFLMTPQRTLPQFNDSYVVNVKGVLGQARTFFTDRKDYQWVTSDGKEGSPPAETSHAFDWSGYFAMRSGWETTANYLVLRAGPIGYGHCQQDKLDVVIWADGRQVLFSAGGGNYEKSDWRTYASSTFSHNCVIVDGKPQVRQTQDRVANIARAPIDARWESTPDHDFAAGVYDQGYGAVDARVATQTRRVLFIKPDIFLVADTLIPIDAAPHTYQARWHLLSTQTRLDPSTKAVSTTDAGAPNLAVVPLSADGLEVRSASAQTQPEILGWRIESDPKRVPATTVLQTRSGAGQQNFLTLFLPLPPGAANPVQSVQATGPNSRMVTLNDGRHFSISVDPDPSGGLEFSESLPDNTKGRHVEIKASSLSKTVAAAPAAAKTR